MFLVSSLSAQTYSWGETVKIGMSKQDINKLIKKYVALKYPVRVENYNKELIRLRDEKLKKYESVTFVKGDFMWQDNKETESLKFNTIESIMYCKKLKLATKKDWRLPSYDELLSLISYFRYDPAKVDGIYYVVSDKYWSSSMVIDDISANWYVDFKYGETGGALKDMKYNVRCVRDMSQEPGEF